MAASPEKRIVYIATHNAHKVKEFQYIAGKDWECRPLSDLNAEISWEETGDNFAENSLIKALAVKKYTSHCVLADDSGLAVEALNGEPGVYSSRYSGKNANDAKNNEKLLKELLHVENRKAAFVCHLVFIDEKGQTVSFEGRCEGEILREKSGTQGFGYDPLFQPTGFQETFASLGEEIKNKISHRNQASQKWLDFVK